MEHLHFWSSPQLAEWERYLIFLFLFSDFLIKNAIDLENIFLIEMDCFNWNDIFLIRIIFFN